MATVSENSALQRESDNTPTSPPFLVDSNSQSLRTDLENTCRILIQNFIKMRGIRSTSSVQSKDPSDLLIGPGFSSPSSLAPIRGMGFSKLSTSTSQGAHLLTSDSSDSLASSVDKPINTSSLMEMADSMEISESRVTSDDIRQLVPETLPLSLRDNVSQVEEKDLERLYNIEAGYQKIEGGHLTAVELVIIHWRSYRNILLYELSDMEGLQLRFLGYFARIFSDLVRRCYNLSDNGPYRLVSYCCVCVIHECV